MKYDKLIERLQKLIGFTPKQAELCKILDYTSSKISARALRRVAYKKGVKLKTFTMKPEHLCIPVNDVKTSY